MKKIVFLLVNAILAFSVMISLWSLSAYGLGRIPPLGKTLNPGTGIWHMEKNVNPSTTEILHVRGLQKAVTIIFEENGTAHIQALTNNDLFWTIGYLHARFRLTQIDLLRRQGEGKLAEILGAQALQQDEFNDTLGLQRTAQANWNALSPLSSGYSALRSYSQGVNTCIQQEEQNNTLPFLFKLLNYQPRPWTPIDSLVVQEVMSFTLSFNTVPLSYDVFVKTLGYTRTMQWFPIFAPDSQHAYDPGPFPSSHTAPLSSQLTPLPAQISQANATITSISQKRNQLAILPQNIFQNSNNWAINGPKTASGKAIMAGDPHLDITLPSIWFTIDASSPDYTFTGASIPGLPIILVGKNQHISWSMTNTQNQTTLFYVEKVDSSHQDQYYWNGNWQKMKHIQYDIAVKGAPEKHFDVVLTVHGPVVSESLLPNQTLSVSWIGARTSTEIQSMFDILRASTFTQFKDALRNWIAPTLTFVYSDIQGNIGMIAPGDYPLVKSGAPWLPLPGTGEADIVGMIPFADVPQVYDPPSHMVFSANQRPVGNNYPYYIGTSLGLFGNGYRADELYNQLSQKQHFTLQDMERLQNSTYDYLASLILPKLIDVLRERKELSLPEHKGEAILAGWDNMMQDTASAPTIWWTFWQQYLTDTFAPWWQAKQVPTATFPSLAINSSLAPLNEDLEAWTLTDPTNPAFTLPSGRVRTASEVMLEAYQETIANLAQQWGKQPLQWKWGNIHTSTIKSFFQIKALGYGPFPSNGDDWTLNVANVLDNSHRPSYRFIVDWGTQQSEAVYPGGQDENPLSPWYQNQISSWQNGYYNPVINFQQAKNNPKGGIWELQPS